MPQHSHHHNHHRERRPSPLVVLFTTLFLMVSSNLRSRGVLRQRIGIVFGVLSILWVGRLVTGGSVNLEESNSRSVDRPITVTVKRAPDYKVVTNISGVGGVVVGGGGEQEEGHLRKVVVAAEEEHPSQSTIPHHESEQRQEEEEEDQSHESHHAAAPQPPQSPNDVPVYVPPPDTPAALDGFADLVPLNGPNGAASQPKTTPVFWHVLKAGGTTVADYLSDCDRLVEASEVGMYLVKHSETPMDTDTLRIVENIHTIPKRKYVSVDTTTQPGLAHAKRLGLIPSGLSDVIFTTFLYQGSSLFDDTPDEKGVMFALFRHPVERAISMFYYLQTATWEPTYKPELADWTIDEYASSELVEENWLVRFLSNNRHSEVSPHDLAVAKEIVRRKILVGLINKMEESMERFERYFGWSAPPPPPPEEEGVVDDDPDDVYDDCRRRYLGRGQGSNSNQHKKEERAEVLPGSETWEKLKYMNEFDLDLYRYVQELFLQQEELVRGDRVG